MNTDTRPEAEQQAGAQLESIIEMVAALECDFDRLAELTEERADLAETLQDSIDTMDGEADAHRAALAAWDAENAAELAELTAAAGECTDTDEARERINEDPLSIEVRSEWTTLGESLTPGEFCILLCTGGPAVRIVGDLDRGEPSRPRLEYQDWGTPWTEYFPPSEGRHAMTVSDMHDALQAYCGAHYFGDE